MVRKARSGRLGRYRDMHRIVAFDHLPAVAGAYGLLLRLMTPIQAPTRRFPSAVLTPGTFLYAGSAYGPGGIAARVRRHTRRNKVRHWHIDRCAAVFGILTREADENTGRRGLEYPLRRDWSPLLAQIRTFGFFKLRLRSAGPRHERTGRSHSFSSAHEISGTANGPLGLFPRIGRCSASLAGWYC